MSSSIQCALPDPVANPNVIKKTHHLYHINNKGHAACNAALVLDPDTADDITATLETERCQRPGCSKHWPEKARF